MTIPTRGKCLTLMQEVGMPIHIQKHCLMVAEIALYLGCNLSRNNIRLDLELIQAGALLHDIAKPRCLNTGERHDELGAVMVQEWGYFPLVPVVREHVFLDLSRATGPLTEALVVNYADKRVKHDRIVSLEERFADLIDRYAGTPEQRSYLRKKLDLYLILEQKIFENLTISPTETELMHLSAELGPEDGSEDYEQQEIDCSIVGRRKVC